MPIRVLPPLLVNQIAAGEVIERPASVVKELVENSLDAGASRVVVAVEEGGRQLIRVSDDGRGIPEAELPLAVAAHATSKIATPEDLAAIGTLGFRGEALASIASVSRLRLSSRATIDGKTAESGAVIEASGQDIGTVSPTACAPGTVVEVRDLFFNTPARRKFMRAASTEFAHVAETVARIALARPDVTIVLTHNGRVTLDDQATDSRRQRCVAILGSELDEALLEFEHVEPWGQVWGLAGQPSIARATSKFIYLYLNGRPIRDRNLQHAIREAYRGLVAPDLNPVAVVFLTLDPHDVDVNVHPAKTEVRFHDPSRLHGLVLTALRQRLLGTDLTPSVGVRGQESGVRGRDSGFSASAFVEYFQRMNPVQKGFVFERVKAAMASEGEQAPLLDSSSSSPSPPPPPTQVSILQVHKSYLVTQDADGIVIVDQHALHERVMFEELSRRVFGDGQPLESQRLLMPVVLRASAQRMALLEELAPLLARIGIETSPLGPDTVGIQAFPSFLFDRGVEADSFVEQLLDLAQEGKLSARDATALESALHEVLDMMACKAAVKAGDALSEQELSVLLAKRAEVERAGSCPHGRPTTIRLTLRDLEKHFQRT